MTKKTKHPMLGKQVRVFTSDEELESYYHLGDATLIHICGSHIVVKIVEDGGDSFLAIHPWHDIKTIDTLSEIVGGQ